MGSRRHSGGRYDFVDDPDEREKRLLNKKFGKSARISSGSGTKKRSASKPIYISPEDNYEDISRNAQIEEKRQEARRQGKPDYWVEKAPPKRKITGITQKARKAFRQLKWWLGSNTSNYRFRTYSALKNLIGFVALLILTLTVYANVESLNEKPFLFLRIGSIALVALTIGSIILLKRFYVNLKYGYKGSRNAIKLLLFLALFMLAIGVYANQDTVFPTLKEKYENINLGKFNPLIFTYKTVSGKAEEVTGGALGKIENILNCPEGYELVDEDCISLYITNPVEKEFEYVVDGKLDKINFELYGGINDYLAGKPKFYYCPPDCSQEDFELKVISEPQQSEQLDKLVELIQSKESESDEQARIAISLVQKIDYDWGALETGTLTGRYPYEVLFDERGVCGEKAKLLAYLLKEIGYGVVLFNYSDHQAVGVKCPKQYSLNGSGYCFIETTRPTIPTNDKENYVLSGPLGNPTSITLVNEGDSFESIKKEYEDAKEWNKIREMGFVLSQTQYNRWTSLVNKYGIEIDKVI